MMIKLVNQGVFVTLFSMLISTTGIGQEVSINGWPIKNFPVIKSESGWSFNYSQKFAKKSADVEKLLKISSRAWKKHSKYPYICGYNSDITLKIVSTAPISVLSVQAKITNYSDNRVRKVAVSYSTDGLKFNTLIEKKFGGGGIKIDATTKLESKSRVVWLRFARLLEKNDKNGKYGNVVFKSINIKLTGENTSKEQAAEAISIVIPDKAVNIPHEWANNYSGAVVRPDLTQRLAAERLQMLISRATGEYAPIVTATKMPKTGLRIFVGYGKHLEGRISPPTKPEGLKIAEKNGNLFLLGEIAKQRTNNWPVAMDRGVMHAVETFAEEVMGYRFMHSTLKDSKIFELGTAIPKLKKLEIKPGLLIEDAPVFNTRLCSTGSGPIIGLRSGSSSNFSCNHSYSSPTWYKAYSKKHPEMFVPLAIKKQDTHAAAMGAQKPSKFLDYTAPLVLKKRLEHLQSFFKSGKGGGFFYGRVPTHNYIMEEPPDFNPPNWRYNKRAEKLWDPARPQWGEGSNIWFDYLNRLGKEVKKRWPKMRISTLAYYRHYAVPTFDIEDNIDVMLALQRTSMENKEPYVFNKNLTHLRRWFEKVGRKRERLYLWEYGCWPTMYVPVPIIPAFAMQKWLQTVKPYVSGVFFEHYPTRQFPDHLMRRIWMRLLWNPNLDLENDIKDFCKHFYGPAGDTMFAFYKKLIKRYEMKWDNPKLIWNQFYVDSSLYYEQSFPKSETAKLLALLNKACRETGTVPEIIESKVQHGAAAYLFNEKNTPSPVKVILSTLDKKLFNPSIGWQGGRIIWQGNLKLGERLEISAPNKAVLFTEDGKSSDVSTKLIGKIPQLTGKQAEVFYFWHTGAKDNLFKLKLSYGNAQDIAEDSKSIYARRLDWQRIPYMLTPGSSNSMHGFFVNAHLAHKNLRHVPKYKVQKQQTLPKTIDDVFWKKIAKSELICGKSKSRYSYDILGYSAFLRTGFQVTYNQDGIAIRFEADSKPVKGEKIILTLNKKIFMFALDAKPTQNSAMKQFQENKDGWQALIMLKWNEISKGKIPKTLSCQIARTRNKESYLWSPPLNMWGANEQGPGEFIIMP